MNELEELANQLQSYFFTSDDILNGKELNCLSAQRCKEIARDLIEEEGYRKFPTGSVKVRDLVKMPEKRKGLCGFDICQKAQYRVIGFNEAIDLIGNLETQALRSLDVKRVADFFKNSLGLYADEAYSSAEEFIKEFGQPAQSLPSEEEIERVMHETYFKKIELIKSIDAGLLKDYAQAIRKLLEEKAR